jgi:hypothetical protein
VKTVATCLRTGPNDGVWQNRRRPEDAVPALSCDFRPNACHAGLGGPFRLSPSENTDVLVIFDQPSISSARLHFDLSGFGFGQDSLKEVAERLLSRAVEDHARLSD